MLLLYVSYMGYLYFILHNDQLPAALQTFYCSIYTFNSHHMKINRHAYSTVVYGVLCSIWQSIANWLILEGNDM